MILCKKKICKGCGKESYIWARGKCKYCCSKETPKKQYKKEPSGELEIFKQCWAERPHKCQCCDKSLGNEMNVFYFSHILSKGAYPRYRLNKDNIWICCAFHHIKWEGGDRSDPVFIEKLKKYDELKIMYNRGE